MGVGFGMFAGLFGLTLGRGRGARFNFELRGLSQDATVLVIVGDEVDLEAGAVSMAQLSVYTIQYRVLDKKSIPLINSRNIFHSIGAVRCFDIFCNEFVDVGIAMHVDQVDAE